jgi:hypothetical protein
MTGWLALLGAAAAGATQAHDLARTARFGARPLALAGRLAFVAAMLVVAAQTGYIILGAAGWALGFVTTAAVEHGRLS